jgi:hypothetical protein
MDRGASSPQASVTRDQSTDLGPGTDPPPSAPPAEPAVLKLGPVLLQTVRHFFPQFNDWLQALPDSRVPQLCVYPTRFLAWWGISLYLFQLGSRRQLNFGLDALGTQVLANLNRVAGTQQTTRPVHGTFDHFLEHVPAEAFAQARTRMIRQLIRNKVLDPARLLGYQRIILDGTGLFCFHQRHCEHCLSQGQGGTPVYLHNVLEAKLLGPGELVLSIDSEFIENADAAAGSSSTAARKQDCELNALNRLAPRLHQQFPQLRLCLTVDGLYACRRFFQICHEYGWAFVVVFKPTILPTVWDEFQSLLTLASHLNVERFLPDGTHQFYCWVSDLPYVDTAGRAWTFTGVQCEETTPDGTTTTFAWLTNLPVED